MPNANLFENTSFSTQPMGYGMVYGDAGLSGQNSFLQREISQLTSPSSQGGPWSLYKELWQHRDNPLAYVNFYLKSGRELDLGVLDTAKGAWEGAKYAWHHPVQTVISLDMLASQDPLFANYKAQVGKALYHSVKNYYSTHTIQRTVGYVATQALAGKGILKVPKLVEVANTARVADLGDASRVVGISGSLKGLFGFKDKLGSVIRGFTGKTKLVRRKLPTLTGTTAGAFEGKIKTKTLVPGQIY